MARPRLPSPERVARIRCSKEAWKQRNWARYIEQKRCRESRPEYLELRRTRYAAKCVDKSPEPRGRPRLYHGQEALDRAKLQSCERVRRWRAKRREVCLTEARDCLSSDNAVTHVVG